MKETRLNHTPSKLNALPPYICALKHPFRHNSEQIECAVGVHSNSNSTGSSAVPQAGTRPATWTDARVLTTSPLSLPLSLPMAQIDPPVEQREGDILPGPVTWSKSTQAFEFPRSPDERGGKDPSGEIARDMSPPVEVNNTRPVLMTKSPAEYVNSSPQVAKRNTSNDSMSSPSSYPSQEGGVGTLPGHSQEGTMDGTDPSRKKKRGLLSIIFPCFG